LITNRVDQEFFRKTEHSHAKEQRNSGTPSGKFIVGFAGLHGLMQDLETVIEAACRLREDERMAFVLYGDGPKKRN